MKTVTATTAMTTTAMYTEMYMFFGVSFNKLRENA